MHLFSFKLPVLTDSLFLIKKGLAFLLFHAGRVIDQLQIELFALKHTENSESLLRDRAENSEQMFVL